jgi:hypothetical protein
MPRRKSEKTDVVKLPSKAYNLRRYESSPMYDTGHLLITCIRAVVKELV